MERLENRQAEISNSFCRVGKITPKRYWEEENEVEQMGTSNEFNEPDSAAEGINVMY